MQSDSKKIIENARKHKIAVPAFNIPYLPMMAPVIGAVRDEDSLAFVDVARLEWMKFEAGGPEAIYKEFVKHEDPDHVRLHLDHIPVIDEDGKEVDYINIIKKALKLGYHSVMVDGSRLPLKENIDCTRRAVTLAHDAGVPCEAELGAVMGHEKEPLLTYRELFDTGKGFTDIEEARKFVESTECDWLSIAAGNIHGAISRQRKSQRKVEAKLDLEHVNKIAHAVHIPLVLHGGSSVTHSYLLKAIELGMAKVNIATEIRQPYENTLAETGDVEKACEAVYDKVVWILREYLKIAGKRKEIMGNQS